MNTISVHFELNNKARSDKRHDILIRFTENRKMRRISTKVYVLRPDFNVKAKHGSWVRSSDPFARKKNMLLVDLRFKAETAQHDIDKKGLSPTLDNVIALMKGEHKAK